MTASSTVKRDPWWQRLPGWVPLAAIGLLAAVVRVFGISTESLWLDEATSLLVAKLPPVDLIRWTANDIHPPLYYLLLHYWVYLGQSELVVRGLSALAGVLTVGALYGLAETLFDRRVGLWTALLLALNPLHVWYSQEARMYALLTLFYTLSLWLALRVWHRPSWGRGVAYVLVTTAALYTHYYGVFAILIANACFLFFWWRRGHSRMLLRTWLRTQAATLVLYLVWLPRLLANLGGGGGWLAFSAGPPSLMVLPQTMILYVVGTARAHVPEAIRRLAYVLTGIAVVAGLVPFLLPGRRLRLFAEGEDSGWGEAMAFARTGLCLPLAAAWIASQVFKPMYSARYMLPFLPSFLLLLAAGLRAIQRDGWRLAVGGLLCLAMGWCLVTQAQVLEKPDWRAIASQVVAESEPGDGVLFVPGWHGAPFAYYAGEALPLYDAMPAMVQQTPDASLGYVREAIRGHERIWFVWETGHYSDPEAQVLALLRHELQEQSVRVLHRLGDLYLFVHPPNDGGAGD